MIAGLAAITALTMPFDNTIQEEFHDPGPQRSSTMQSASRVFNAAGDPGVFVTALAMYGVGRMTHSSHLTTLGEHAGEAIITSGAVTATLKMAIGRQRPNVQSSDADDFLFGRGFGGAHASLPSGHTTAAFAFATAVTYDLRQWDPHAAHIAGPLLYGGATMVGLSRIYADKHWASDVVLGAGVGTFVGYKTVAYVTKNPNNWVARHLRSINIAPRSDARGMTFSMSMR